MKHRPIGYLRAARRIWWRDWFTNPIECWQATRYRYLHGFHYKSRREWVEFMERARAVPPVPR